MKQITERIPALPLPPARFVSRVQAAAFFGVSPGTFDKMRWEGIAPAPKRVYGRVLWDVVELNAAADALSGLSDADRVAEREEMNEWDM